MAVEKRREAAEEKRATTEKKIAEVKERKQVMKAMVKSREEEQKLMTMDMSNLDEKARTYFEMHRDRSSIGGKVYGRLRDGRVWHGRIHRCYGQRHGRDG